MTTKSKTPKAKAATKPNPAFDGWMLEIDAALNDKWGMRLIEVPKSKLAKLRLPSKFKAQRTAPDVIDELQPEDFAPASYNMY